MSTSTCRSRRPQMAARIIMITTVSTTPAEAARPIICLALRTRCGRMTTSCISNTNSGNHRRNNSIRLNFLNEGRCISKCPKCIIRDILPLKLNNNRINIIIANGQIFNFIPRILVSNRRYDHKLIE